VNQIKKSSSAGALAPPSNKVRRGSSAKDLFRQSRIKATSADDIVDWINTKISAVRPGVKISGLADPAIDASFLIDLLSVLSPASVNLSLVDKCKSFII